MGSDNFTITLVTVAVMLAYAIPGYLLVKTKAVKSDSIPAFAKVLMYVCQPALAIYSFNQVDYTPELFRDMGIFFGISMGLLLVCMGILYLFLRNKKQDIRYRIAIIGGCFGNCAFLGVPLLEALLPNYPNAVVFSTVFFIAMSILCWTVGSAIITQNLKYVSIKKILLNPAVLALIVALPLFFTNTKLPDSLDTMTTLLGKMSTPLCMIIMGMRLATSKLKPIFGEPLQYFTVVIKQLLFPLFGLLVVWFLPIAVEIKQTLFIMCCCPTASIVQSLSEMLGEGQEPAANLVLLSSMTCVLTIPLVLLIPIV